jgi:hypothetical protein
VPSRRKDITGRAIDRRIAAGFGQGEGALYKPWLRISDVPSKGTCTIITGWKHGREHHLLSRNERNYFYCLEWQDDVVEAREQFPLLPLQRTLEIAGSLGFKHPGDRGRPIVMTTDFFLTVREKDGSHRHLARTVKPSSELKKTRIQEKFEIERQYFSEKNVDWGVITPEQIPDAMWRNIDWLHECWDVRKLRPILQNQVDEAREWLFETIGGGRSIRLQDLAATSDHALGFRRGTSLKIIRHLIANKQIQVDITKRLRTDVPIKLAIERQSA